MAKNRVQYASTLKFLIVFAFAVFINRKAFSKNEIPQLNNMVSIEIDRFYKTNIVVVNSPFECNNLHDITTGIEHPYKFRFIIKQLKNRVYIAGFSNYNFKITTNEKIRFDRL